MQLDRGLVIGNYTLERELSRGRDRGGMSHVLLVHETQRKQYKAVIKVNRSDGESAVDYQNLLKRETFVLRQLHHPNIVHIYPQKIGKDTVYMARVTGLPERPWYYTMEFVSGGSLDHYISDIAGTFPLEWTFELFYQLLTTVNYMHRCGYAHCDIKPQNIMFRRPPHPEEVPSPVLIDFGSASPVQSVDTLTMSVQYSSPEVLMATRKDVDTDNGAIRGDKVDIWGLGVTLFEMVTGRPLFDQKSKAAITTTILRGELKRMSQERPKDVNDSLDTLLEVMLRRNPQSRPGTSQLIKVLEEKIASIRPPRVALRVP